jgi:PLP dependent protein
MAADAKHSVGNRAEALAAVRQKIDAACRDAGRDPSSVTLVAISKTFAADAVAPVIGAGHRVFGENRVQEAKAKWPPLKAQYPDLELHLVGPLQTNKVKDALALFDMIHTIDRPSLCATLAQQMAKNEKRPRLLVEVNTGAEPQKAGVLPEAADRFLASCRDEFGLDIAGLTCVPPVDEPPAPHFALLAKIAARNKLKFLSMGMSADFTLAIALGATHVRVGTAIFGVRA